MVFPRSESPVKIMTQDDVEAMLYEGSLSLDPYNMAKFVQHIVRESFGNRANAHKYAKGIYDQYKEVAVAQSHAKLGGESDIYLVNALHNPVPFEDTLVHETEDTLVHETVHGIITKNISGKASADLDNVDFNLTVGRNPNALSRLVNYLHRTK